MVSRMFRMGGAFTKTQMVTEAESLPGKMLQLIWNQWNFEFRWFQRIGFNVYLLVFTDVPPKLELFMENLENSLSKGDWGGGCWWVI